MMNYILCLSIFNGGVLKSEAYQGFYGYERLLEKYISTIKEYISTECDTIIDIDDGVIELATGSERVKIYAVDVRKGRII